MSSTKITPTSAGPIKWEHFYGSRPDPGPVVVSYFTDLFYLREAFELARTCQDVGLDYSIRQVPDGGSWQKNTSFKPTFLLQMHELFPNRDLLWLDADARVRQYPERFRRNNSYIAYHTWRGLHANSGTVYLGWVQLMRKRILERWQEVCLKHPLQTDQISMEQAVKGLVRHTELPVSYCWIYDFDHETEGTSLAPAPDSSPVIEHMQASRWSKLMSKKR